MIVTFIGVNHRSDFLVKRKMQTGFSLIELIMVIVIMGALSAVAMTRFDRSTFEAQAAAGELIQAIRYAQEKSMTNTGAPNYQIQILNNGYNVTQNAVAITHPIEGTVGYTRNWANITIAPIATIIFDGYGNPALGGPMIFTVTQGASSATVTVEDVTGFAR